VRLAYQKKAVRSIIDLSEQRFYPSVPEDLNQTGLNEKLIEDLIFKLLLSRGVMPGRQIADEICLPLKIIENTMSDLKRALFLTYRSNSGINDFAYILSEQGRENPIQLITYQMLMTKLKKVLRLAYRMRLVVCF
jgi:hypothetical protein